MTVADVARIKGQITKILQANAGISPARTVNLLPTRSLQGKLYEAHVLATIIENLVSQEGLQITLIGGSVLTLRQKGGQINRAYPYFEVRNGGVLLGELFMDTYFATISFQMRGAPIRKTNGDYHELDIALLRPNLIGYPQHTDVILAVECKNTSIKKSIIRELLGFRRELAFYTGEMQPTPFNVYPTNQTMSYPNSVHMLYCSDSRISRYTENCLQFGILLQHHRI
ncbi:hypothetical protein OMO38_05230 [Chryseobacterium sp. 09-1422]|uniref:Uncharacterized protein n=1 Tax=Chryseobacterium kimseyorum TaxID=2984028 RepID=A0ABT3HVV1_9FLAO|nr:hypothetical protein [Chryseobacterium kimseyorum]MCW3167925.1 hypothetical protein [Chryseobacterium kimseyorum]